MLLADHGVFRLFYLNKHQVTDRLWRSAQPAPHQIAALKAEGVRTIVNLRGGREHGSWQLQKEACERLGIQSGQSSSSAPAARRTGRRCSPRRNSSTGSSIRPSCIANRARTGPASSPPSISWSIEGKSIDEAQRQLSMRFGHFRFSKTGILDEFFDLYRREGEAKGIPFLTWIETQYDAEALERNFRPSFWSSLLVDRIMRRE